MPNTEIYDALREADETELKSPSPTAPSPQSNVIQETMLPDGSVSRAVRLIPSVTEALRLARGRMLEARAARDVFADEVRLIEQQRKAQQARHDRIVDDAAADYEAAAKFALQTAGIDTKDMTRWHWSGQDDVVELVSGPPSMSPSPRPR